MAFISGTAGSVAYISGGTTTIVGAHEWSLDIGGETPEVTAFGDQWRVYLPGIREWSASVSVRADGDAASQTFVRNLLLGGSVATAFRFYQGTNFYAGSAIATGASPSIAYDDAATMDVDLQGSGALSYT
jgi:predicted secreted protein